MSVPLALTLWFSPQRYYLLNPFITGFAGLENYRFLLTDPSLWVAMGNTLLLVGWVVAITIALGTLLAVLFDQDFFGRGVARLLAIAPFRSEEHTSELQSLMRISYAVFCLKKQKKTKMISQ